jgi:hypothetical protein
MMPNRQRDELAKTYEKLLQAGQATPVDIIRALSEYDATYATIRMAYSLLSTIIAAFSATASAVAAYFAYAASYIPQ